LNLPLRIDIAGILAPKFIDIENSCGCSPTTAGAKEGLLLNTKKLPLMERNSGIAASFALHKAKLAIADQILLRAVRVTASRPVLIAESSSPAFGGRAQA